MASTITISDPAELHEFVRTHLDHRLTALVAPIIDEANAFRVGREDISKAAQEGSYVMLRLFIEFLGVKGQKNGTLEERAKLPINKPGSDVQSTDLVLSCFTGWSLQDLKPSDFGSDAAFLAKIHRTLCKINAHFTYDCTASSFYDRIASLARADFEKAVKIVVDKLDEHFYQRVGKDIVVHCDLQAKFTTYFNVNSTVASH
jgi:hypothetical protein